MKAVKYIIMYAYLAVGFLLAVGQSNYDTIIPWTNILGAAMLSPWVCYLNRKEKKSDRLADNDK